MNALKAHERYQKYLAEQERQVEIKRIKNMTPEERAEYKKEQEELRNRLNKHLSTFALVSSMLSAKPYNK